jgi:hypothetical protein
MVKITMWVNENKKLPVNERVSFALEEFVGDTICEAAVKFCDELKDYKIRIEKIIKGGKVVGFKEYKKGKIRAITITKQSSFRLKKLIYEIIICNLFFRLPFFIGLRHRCAAIRWLLLDFLNSFNDSICCLF